MIQKSYSLRLRLMALIGGPVVLAGIVIAGLAMIFTYHEIDEVYDAQLAQAAKLLLQLTQHEIMDHERHGLSLEPEAADFSHFYEKKLWYRIWQKDRLITQSHEADTFSATIAPPGFSWQSINSARWRFFVYVDSKTGITVEVVENGTVRTELILQILSSLIIPGLIFLPLILIIVWVGTSKSLRPIKSIAEQLNQRNAHDLSALCDKEPLPQEITPFVSSINRLFLRVNETFLREREFTDNAAHELRTPLAAMKTQTQVLAKKALQMPDCKEGLDNLLDSINRSSQLVDQLLSFARLQNHGEKLEKVHLSFLAEETLREIHPLTLQRHQSLDADIEQNIYLEGYTNALGILLRNLVDNAIKYAPAHGKIIVSLSRLENKIILTISDNGSGIPQEHQDKVFQRFYRVNKSASTGSGLGLSIVQWVADMHHATIAMENLNPHGLAVRVIFS